MATVAATDRAWATAEYLLATLAAARIGELAAAATMASPPHTTSQRLTLTPGPNSNGMARGPTGLPQFVGIFGVSGGYLAWSEA